MVTIYIVGVGGRTGAMLARELQGVVKIVGVGLDREIEAINAEKIKIQRGDAMSEVFLVKTTSAGNFGNAIAKNYPDFIWFAVRNPVRQVVEFYYRNFAGKDIFPTLILSQNGISAIDDARAGLVVALGQDADKVRIIRVSLMNGIDLKMDNDVATISYKLPIKLGFAPVPMLQPPFWACPNGMRKKGEMLSEQAISAAGRLKKIFIVAKFKAQELAVLDMENSKLFVNLIGMASAINVLSMNAVLCDKIVFEEVILKEEIAALKEFVLVVKKSGHGFVGVFCGYPIAMLAKMVLLPAGLLLPFRFIFEKIVNKGRNRTKNTSEIDYYNGEVVKLGKKFGVPTPINDGIVARAKLFTIDIPFHI